jgi:hypothetical protein
LWKTVSFIHNLDVCDYVALEGSLYSREHMFLERVFLCNSRWAAHYISDPVYLSARNVWGLFIIGGLLHFRVPCSSSVTHPGELSLQSRQCQPLSLSVPLLSLESSLQFQDPRLQALLYQQTNKCSNTSGLIIRLCMARRGNSMEQDGRVSIQSKVPAHFGVPFRLETDDLWMKNCKWK